MHGLNNKEGSGYLLGATCTHGARNPLSDACLVKVMEHTTSICLEKPIISLFTSENMASSRARTSHKDGGGGCKNKHEDVGGTVRSEEDVEGFNYRTLSKISEEFGSR